MNSLISGKAEFDFNLLSFKDIIYLSQSLHVLLNIDQIKIHTEG